MKGRFRSKWSYLVLVFALLIIFDRIRLAIDFPEARTGLGGSILVTFMYAYLMIYAIEHYTKKKSKQKS